MPKLQTLHNQLYALKRARTSVRWGAGMAALAVAVLWLLLGVFALDVIFEMSVEQRIVVIVLAGVGVIWAFNKFTRPFLGIHESELEMALLVEKQQRIDSDLVAALQFESADAKRWGSPQLETAVIDYVAELGPGLNVFEGFSRRQLSNRATTFGATLVGLLLLVGVFPSYAAVFLDRLFLGNRHYPSATKIEDVMVNYQHVLSYDRNGTAPDSIKGAQSRPIQFLVRCSGTLPNAGVVRTKNIASGQVRKLDLIKLSLDERLARLRQADLSLQAAAENMDQSLGGNWRNENLALTKLDAPSVAELLLKAEQDRDQLPAVRAELAKTIAEFRENAGESALYLCELGRMIDSVNYKIHLGDAWTDPAKVEMIPLPTVEPRLRVVPPKYARREDETRDPSSRQLSVLEGSTVEIVIDCTNNKPLAAAWLIARTKNTTTKYDLRKDAAAKTIRWSLPVENTPFHRVTSEIRFEIQVNDEDNLQLETPIQGMIRIKADRPPTGSADVVHRVILPTAKPVIEYRMNDDYGIGEVSLHMQVERLENTGLKSLPPATEADNNTTPVDPDAVAKPRPEEKHTVRLRAAEPPILADELPFLGKHEVSLSPLKLIKGDRLKLTLEIHDYRGELPGETFLSEPLFLEISDEDGVFSAILDADKKADQRLSEIIKRQLGIGETP